MFRNLGELWTDARTQSKLGFAVGVIVVLGLCAWVTHSMLKSEQGVLFSELAPRDAAAIVAELERLKIPYSLGGDESSVLVSKDQVHATRLKLMNKGVQLQGGVGLEIFNNTDFGMTEFAQKINYQRALQGELARTIMALDEVKFARVHLVMPESGLFKKSNSTPKASVTVTMKDGRSLSPEQVLGVQRLVGASVPEIAPTEVTVLDQRGVTLTRRAASEKEEMFASVKQEVEAYLAKKVVAVLDKTFGPGQAIVSIDATINHEQTKVTQEDVIPMARRGGEATGTIVRRRTTTQGTVGESAGLGEGEVQTRNGSSTTEVEYQSGRRVEQIISQAGSLRRLSLAVMLPRNFEKQKIEELRQVLSMAVGLNAARGDEIAISSLDQFSGQQPENSSNSDATATQAGVTPQTSAPEAQPEKAASKSTQASTQTLSPASIPWIIGIVAILSIVLTVLWLRKRERPLSAQERERLLMQTRQWLRSQGATLQDSKSL
jgi:flagellar M-ring protein FliF